MTWEYRLGKHHHGGVEVIEAYFNEDDKFVAYSDANVYGETIEEAKHVMRLFRVAFEKPILEIPRHWDRNAGELFEDEDD